MKNILFISQDTVLYGAPKSMLNIIDGLKDKINFTVLIPYDGELINELKKRNVKYYITRYYWDEYILNSYKDYLLFIFRIIRQYMSFIKTLILVTKLHSKQPFNIIHTNSGVLRIGFNISKILRIPHIWHVREFQIEDYQINILYGISHFKRLLKKSDKVICVSNVIKKHFELNLNAITIYNGVMPANKGKIIEIKQNYFIYASSLSVSKGVFDVLVAFQDFVKSNNSINLILCGTGNENTLNNIKKYINKNNLSDRVQLYGYRKDILELMSEAKACIMSSHNEAFGRTTAEAMFMGCPVIGKATKGTLELIQSKKYGYLYNTHDELVSCMKEVVNPNNKKTIDNIINNAQTRARELFSQEQLCKKVFKIYNEI